MLKKKANPPHRGRFVLLLAVLLTVIGIRYSFQIDIPRAVFVGMIIVIALLGDRNEIISLIVCCIPLHESVDLFYSVVSCVLIYFLKFHRTIRINSSIMVFLIMFVWELLHYLGAQFSPVEFLSAMIPLIVLAVFMCMDKSDLDYPLVVRSLSFTTLSAAASLLLNFLYKYDFNFLLAVSKLQRLGVAMEESGAGSALLGGMINPNSLGVICVLATTGLMQIRSMRQGTRTDMILACLIVVFGALTASRTYLVCLAAMVVLLALSYGETAGQRMRFMGLLVMLGILAYAILRIVFPDLLEYYFGRFLEKDITTGRADLMTHYHAFIMDNPSVLCFGIGLQDFSTRLVEGYRVSFNAPHNSIQELIIAWGMPGILMLTAMVFAMYRTSIRFRSPGKLLNSIPLLIILLKGMAGQMINSAYTMLAFSFAYLSLCVDMAPREENEEQAKTRRDSPKTGTE